MFASAELQGQNRQHGQNASQHHHHQIQNSQAQSNHVDVSNIPSRRTILRPVPSKGTSKSYNRAIKYYNEWASSSASGIQPPNKDVITPKRLHAFLSFSDQYKRKSKGDRYSFSYYEQLVSSLVILYEHQKSQWPSRPELSEDGEPGNGMRGEWVHPRDRKVRDLLKAIHDRELEESNYAAKTHSRSTNAQHANTNVQREPQMDNLACLSPSIRPPTPRNQQGQQHQAQRHRTQSHGLPPVRPASSQLQTGQEKQQQGRLHGSEEVQALQNQQPRNHHNEQHPHQQQHDHAALAGSFSPPLLQQPENEMIVSQLERRLDAIEAHLKLQTESIARTNTLLSLYHKDLSERDEALTQMSHNTGIRLVKSVEEVHQLMTFLFNSDSENHKILRQLLEERHKSLDRPSSPSMLQANGTTGSITEAMPIASSGPIVQENNRSAASTNDLNHTALPIPQLKLRDMKEMTVEDLWEEYIHGYDGQPSLKFMEQTYKTRWRVKGVYNKTVLRRLKVCTAIEKASEVYNESIESLIKELSDYLKQESEEDPATNGGKPKKKRSPYWLSEHMPSKLRFE